MRPTRDETMMDLARTIAKRSTCPRRGVGAVLVDANGRVLAMGHNGVAMGEPHCSEGHFCGGEGFATGAGLVACRSCHAEQNALVFCADAMKIDALYVTASPCQMCIRYYLNTSCARVVYDELYDEEALARWVRAGRTAVRLEATVTDHRSGPDRRSADRRAPTGAVRSEAVPPGRPCERADCAGRWTRNPRGAYERTSWSPACPRVNCPHAPDAAVKP